jgi:hypothetical protein
MKPEAEMAGNEVPMIEVLERREFDHAELVRQYPPRWHHEHKRSIWSRLESVALATPGVITYSRWRGSALPVNVPRHEPEVDWSPGVFRYGQPVVDRAAIWHLNFADPSLFVAYGSSLMAQDEHQVLEHPSLGSVRECLVARREPILTVDHRGPTPVILSGVPRLCHFETETDRGIAGDQGVYGNRFASATLERVLRGLRPLDPPTQSNIIALAAPRPRFGAYTRGDIVEALTAATAGFAAARLESQRRYSSDTGCWVRTGWWGCGAFGGNRELMVVLQTLAARLAGVQRLSFHTVEDQRGHTVQRAWQTLERCLADSHWHTSEVIDQLVSLKYEWGESDGN